MRRFAIAKQQRLGITSVEFVDGVAEDLSRFADGAFDRMISVHGAPFAWSDDAFVRECLRVVRRGGYVLFGGTTGPSRTHEPGATDPTPTQQPATFNLLKPHAFQRHLQPVSLDFGSVEEALATWGFIYGDAAIDYLLANPIYALNDNLVIHHRQV